MNTQHLSPKQAAILDELTEELTNGRALSVLERLSLPDYACMLDEARRLQMFVNKEGTTYTVVGRSGDTYTKHRPEYQQLNELRKELRQMRKALTLEGIEEKTPASEFFAA